MKPFNTVTGAAAPLMLANIDTDVIIRIEWLAALNPDQMGEYAFEALRFHENGTENPNFVFNRAPFRQAPILIAGANFGCGSSREAAVWALKGMGLRAVIAESFGDIFAANCFQNGILPITLPATKVESFAEIALAGESFTINLEALTITAPDGATTSFTIDAQQRAALLDGVDEIDRTLLWAEQIEQWQVEDRAARPWVWRIPPEQIVNLPHVALHSHPSLTDEK